MQYQEFLDYVSRRARFNSNPEASAAVRATLETLAECLTQEWLDRLCQRLPSETHFHLTRTGGPEHFSIHEFFERVSDRMGVDKALAVQRAWAVVSVIEQVLTLEEVNDLRQVLPRQYERLFEFAV